MDEIKKITKHLKTIFVTAELRVGLTNGHAFSDDNDESIEIIFNYLMELRVSNYSFYLKCLAMLIFQPDYYWETIEILESREMQDLTPEEDLALDEIQEIIDLLDESPDLVSFDQALEANDELEKIEDIIGFYAQYLVEGPGEATYLEIFYDFDSARFYEKLIGTQAYRECFIEGIKHGMEKDCEALVDMVDLLYENTGLHQKSYELHQYIVQAYNVPSHIESLGEYLHEVLWATYLGGLKRRRNGTGDEESELYIQRYETEPNFVLEKCKELINLSVMPTIFRLFLANHQLSVYQNEATEKTVVAELAKEEENRNKVKAYLKKLHKSN